MPSPVLSVHSKESSPTPQPSSSRVCSRLRQAMADASGASAPLREKPNSGAVEDGVKDGTVRTGTVFTLHSLDVGGSCRGASAFRRRRLSPNILVMRPVMLMRVQPTIARRHAEEKHRCSRSAGAKCAISSCRGAAHWRRHRRLAVKRRSLTEAADGAASLWPLTVLKPSEMKEHRRRSRVIAKRPRPIFSASIRCRRRPARSRHGRE